MAYLKFTLDHNYKLFYLFDYKPDIAGTCETLKIIIGPTNVGNIVYCFCIFLNLECNNPYSKIYVVAI